MSGFPEVFDLHVHSLFSDGLYTPLQLLDLARRSGVAGIAIADHDRLPDAEWLSPRTCVKGRAMPTVLAAVELSTLFNGHSLHLLAYGFDIDNVEIKALSAGLLAERKLRMARLLEGLRGQRIGLPPAALSRLTSLASPGRKHLARELVAARHAGSIPSAFARYLIPLNNVSAFARPEVADAIAIVQRAGGKTVVAHPHWRLTDDNWRQLADYGLDGIECGFPASTARRRKQLAEIAGRFAWLQTAGSDYHGDNPAEGIARFRVGRNVWEALGGL